MIDAARLDEIECQIRQSEEFAASLSPRLARCAAVKVATVDARELIAAARSGLALRALIEAHNAVCIADYAAGRASSSGQSGQSGRCPDCPRERVIERPDGAAGTAKG